MEIWYDCEIEFIKKKFDLGTILWFHVFEKATSTLFSPDIFENISINFTFCIDHILSVAYR